MRTPPPNQDTTARGCKCRAIWLQQHYVASARVTSPTARHLRLDERYIAGELCWSEYCELRDAPLLLP